MSVSPYKIMMPDDIHNQTCSGMARRDVDALSARVKRVMQMAVDPMIRRGLYRCLLPNDHHKITGSTGKTQGAKTLSTPAKNDKSARVIEDRI